MKKNAPRGAALGLIALALVTSPAAAQEPEAPAEPVQVPSAAPGDLSEIAAAVVERWNMPGISCAIVTSEGVHATGAAGVRVRGRGVEVTSEDRFQLDTCTMAFTAALMAILDEKGVVSLDTTLGEAYGKKLDRMRPEWKDVTVASLLTHTAGALEDVKDIQGLFFRMKNNSRTPAERRFTLLEEVTKREPIATPGERWIFSHSGYLMACAVLERATDKSFKEVLGTHLLEPLGIEGQWGAPNRREGILQPAGHDKRGIAVGSKDNPRPFHPATGLNVSVPDWAKFVQMLLQGARGKEGLLLSKEGFERLFTPVLAEGHPGTGYGLGWALDLPPWSAGTVYTHNGGNEMWYCRATLAPAEDFAVLVAVNQGGTEARGAGDDLIARLVQVALERRVAGTLTVPAQTPQDG